MCLLMNIPATTEFDKEDILDFYDHNKDGVGVMFAENGVLHVKKILPRNAEDAWAFYNDVIKGKECIAHFRLKTHGDIDMENCHPYKVFGEGEANAPVYMAHNGVLSTGNAADKSKSDTWHYINDIIRPCAQGSSDILFVPAFVSLLEKHIGSTNKFIFMDANGRVSVVNKQAFVQYKGADLSNTYAWTASRGGYGPRNTYGGAYFPRHWGGYSDDDFFGGGEAVTTSHWSSPYNSQVEYSFASDLFMALRQVQYDKAHKSLTYDEAKKYRITMGELQSNRLLEAVRGKKLTETAVMGYVRSMRAYSEATVLALPSATTGGVGAGQEYAADFFTTCQARGLMVAYKHFSVQDIVDFHEAVGEEEAQKFLDRMDSGVLTARHVIEDVEKAVLNFVLSTQQMAAFGGA